MAEPTVEVAEDGPIATLMLSNPARRNAISAGMWRQIRSYADGLSARPEIRAVLIRGAGSVAFSGGADITDFASARSGTADAASYDELVETTCKAVEAIRCPVVALIHGACIGAGMSLAASCDLRVASSGAFFAVPAARLGLGYDPAGIARFVRLVGPITAKQLLLTADRMPAERAHQLGFLTDVATPPEAEVIANRLLARLAENAPLTLAAAKAAVGALARGDDTALAEATRLYSMADASQDYAEGRAAFAEKRAPRFVGR